jgi:membrane-anchored protein YejM (alkaline phosphatase superfamily)
VARYNERVHTPSCPNASAFFGSERGKDVILFVYETGPERSFAIARSRSWLPALEELADSGFVATRHYTTYPYTSDALFSILSGRYPLNRRNLITSGRADLEDSLTQQLRRAGYDFRVYSSFGDTFEADIAMFDAFGAASIYVPDAPGRSPQISRRVAAVLEALGPQSPMLQQPASGRMRERLAQDLAAFEQLSTDVLEMKRRGQRFTALYLPQIGHAPWFDLDGTEDIVARGAAAMRLQDLWLGELVEMLRLEGHLDSTVIVVTSDHGVRTKNEDASFGGGTISDYSFHVPLVIHAPNAAPQTREIAHMTSHVDLASTLSSLLGVSATPVAQGVPIWCEDLDQRATFFLARAYLGADGYRLGDTFVMHAALTGNVYESSSMDFLSRRLASPEAAARHIGMLTDVRQLTLAWNMPRREPAARSGSTDDGGTE